MYKLVYHGSFSKCCKSEAVVVFSILIGDPKGKIYFESKFSKPCNILPLEEVIKRE
jgi:hypothetical protein